MPAHFDRRTLLKAALLSALPAALPRGAFAQMPREVDAIIVGAGAAGIAAARRLSAQGRSHVILEALPRIGGRIAGTISPFGTPADLGAHRLYTPRQNPLVAYAEANKFELYAPLLSRRLYLGMREARDAEYDDFTAAVRRTARAIAAAGEVGQDLPATSVLPDLGDWHGTASFLLGPLTSGVELDRISTVDFSRAAERSEELAARAGMAALILAASRGIPVQLNTPVRAIQVAAKRNVVVETARGAVQAHAVIVTASPGVLAAGMIRFSPSLPERISSALSRMTMGVQNRIAFELPGNPLRLKDDETILFRALGRRTMRLVGRVGGTDTAYADIGGAFARELSGAGEREMLAFVREMLTAHFGADVAKRVGWSAIARWDREEYFRGSHAAVQPGFAGARRTLFDAANERIFFAGEAIHETHYGTVAGAMLSGERAALAALRVLPAKR